MLLCTLVQCQTAYHCNGKDQSRTGQTHQLSITSQEKKLYSGRSKGKTAAKHFIRFRSAIQGAVKITDFARDRRINLDFH